MAGIKDCLRDILSKLTTMQVVNQDGNTVALYARIFNNQVQDELQGDLYIYPKPASFVELIAPNTWQINGQYYRNSDIVLRIHLVHEFANADGTFEQDLAIFDLRDQMLALLSGYTPAGCGPLNCMVESQSFVHTNIYEYLLDFVCNFTDSKASPLDEGRNVYVPSVPPITLEVDETSIKGGGQPTRQTFIISKS